MLKIIKKQHKGKYKPKCFTELIELGFKFDVTKTELSMVYIVKPKSFSNVNSWLQNNMYQLNSFVRLNKSKQYTDTFTGDLIFTKNVDMNIAKTYDYELQNFYKLRLSFNQEYLEFIE